MPIYEYQCTSCSHRTEVMQRVSDPPLTECSECGGELKKLISAPAFQFKGSGWYVTDYARKDAKGAENGKKEGKEPKSDAKAGSETKSETKSTTKSGSGAAGSSSATTS